MMTDEQSGATAVDDVEPETIAPPPETNGADAGTDPAPDETTVGDREMAYVQLHDAGRPADTRFTCVACGVVNHPAEPSDTCGACGKVQPEPEPATATEPPTAPPTDDTERAKALVHAMQGAIGDPQEIENIERQAVGLPPKPSRLPLRGIGKAFDWEAAFEDLHQISLEVAVRTREHDELKKRTKSAKDGLDLAQERLRSMFEHYYENKTASDEAPGLPFDGPPSACPIERETGAPCPACQSQRAKGVEADPNEPLHPAHPQHADVARALLVKDMDHLSNLLLGKHLYVKGWELAHLSVADLQVLQRYAAQKGPVPPPLLQRAHLAAEPGTDRQECTRCGLVLMNQGDLDAGDVWFPVRAAVGLDCPGSPVEDAAAIDAAIDVASSRHDAQPSAAHEDETAAAEPTADPARRLPKRGSKKAKKPAPEQERTDQVTAGRKAAAKKTKARK